MKKQVDKVMASAEVITKLKLEAIKTPAMALQEVGKVQTATKDASGWPYPFTPPAPPTSRNDTHYRRGRRIGGIRKRMEYEAEEQIQSEKEDKDGGRRLSPSPPPPPPASSSLFLVLTPPPPAYFCLLLHLRLHARRLPLQRTVVHSTLLQPLLHFSLPSWKLSSPCHVLVLISDSLVSFPQLTPQRRPPTCVCQCCRPPPFGGDQRKP
eukprot:105855-Pyramimonas_sp.AAC.1